MGVPAVTVALTGDLMLDHSIVRDDSAGAGVSPSAVPSGTAAVWTLFASTDLVMANLECPLTARGAPADKHIAFRTDPALARDLSAAGVDVVTLANNHMADCGLDGMFDTLEALAAAGVAAVGAGRDLATALAPAILTASGLRVAFVGVASTLPVGSGAAPDRPGIAPVRVTTSYVVDAVALEETPGIAPVVETRAWPGDVEAVTRAVTAAKRAADVCIVGIHWGVPNGWVAQVQDPIAQYQRPVARALIEAGADAVVGHHPHVLHGIEVINGRPIFYSLGNFLFHTLHVGAQPVLRRIDPMYSWRSLRSPVNQDSAVAVISFEAGRPSAVELIPVIVNAKGEPELAGPRDAARILASLTDMSAPLGARIDIQGARGRVALAPVGAQR